MRTLAPIGRIGGLALTLALATAPALAQHPVIDYYGYAWGDGTAVADNPGDHLNLVTVADFADPLFGIDLASEELTLYMYDLTSQGSVDQGSYTWTAFTGGVIEIWRDSARNADWGTMPPNPTAPATFSDGSLFFRGSFNDFTLYEFGGSGSFEGTINGLGGEMIADVCTGCAYTFGGTFTTDVGAQMPLGYDYQVDGLFRIEATVAEEGTSWGSLKALFRN